MFSREHFENGNEADENSIMALFITNVDRNEKRLNQRRLCAVCEREICWPTQLQKFSLTVDETHERERKRIAIHGIGMKRAWNMRIISWRSGVSKAWNAVRLGEWPLCCARGITLLHGSTKGKSMFFFASAKCPSHRVCVINNINIVNNQRSIISSSASPAYLFPRKWHHVVNRLSKYNVSHQNSIVMLCRH